LKKVIQVQIRSFQDKFLCCTAKAQSKILESEFQIDSRPSSPYDILKELFVSIASEKLKTTNFNEMNLNAN